MKNNYTKVASYEARKGEFDKVLLLYSGGLDTSVMIKWLQDNYGVDVYTLTLNIGQVDDNLEKVKEKAVNLGVKKAIVLDAQAEFANEYLTKAIKMNADYQNGYHLFCPLGRAIIAKKVVEVAQQEGIKVIAHGCTGKGNDQVRFDSYITMLDPSMKIIAPVREWSMGRSEEIEYAKKHKIPLSNHDPKYSYDENLWGCSAEGGEIEDVKLSPDLEKILIMNQLVEKAVNNVAEIEIEFEKGIPVALNGQKLDIVNLIKALFKLGSAYGIGTKIFVEDRIVGLKVRGVYEQPAAEILITAHKELEKLVSTKEENEFKASVDNKWAYMCYGAKWYEPLMNDLNAFADKVNEKVTGKVHLKLYKGNVMVTSIDSKYSLVNSNMASFDNGFS
ncbi:MAG: argininosuccinate synthase, partial [Candidatus Gracilibacteria bacterium]